MPPRGAGSGRRGCWPRRGRCGWRSAPAEGGDATAEPDGVRWRASFAVPLRLVDSGSFALAVGRELLVDLPAPDSDEHGNGSSDLHVRLAREANGLRQRADEAREAAAAALARADSERAARERAEAELRGARHAREELATRLAQFETELAGRDAAVEALRREHEAELERRERGVRARAATSASPRPRPRRPTCGAR